jgi:hypothetical protein
VRVYIAGPYTIGDKEEHVNNAITMGAQVMDLGHSPFIPHLSHFVELKYPRAWERWMEVDEDFLSICEALIRIPGESKGADREVKMAMALGIPVFNSVADFAEEFCK